jgi:DNA-binding transcriptional LysR family regulator
VPATSMLARRGTTPASEEIAQHPLIGAKSQRLDSSIECRLRAEGRHPHVVFRSDVAETVQAVTAAGLGVAALPRLAVDERRSEIRMLDLGDLLPPQCVGLIWHRDRQLGGPALDLRNAIRRACRTLGQGGSKTQRVRRFDRAMA